MVQGLLQSVRWVSTNPFTKDFADIPIGFSDFIDIAIVYLANPPFIQSGGQVVI